MALATKTAMTALATMLSSTGGTQHVYTGAPESFDKRVSAYVVLAGQEPFVRSSGLLWRDFRLFVAFAYRVKGAEATAEDSLADWIDAFLTQWYADQAAAAGFFATVRKAELSMGLADSPEYLVFAGQENRVYPFLVSATQEASI